MIAIVDYGLGNVNALANIYKRLNIPAVIASTPQQLESAQKLILPGVGAFDWALKRLNESGLRDTVERLVVRDKKPVLGICVGMQIMANRSDEGTMMGLGWIAGQVKKIDSVANNPVIALPHMGWNDVTLRLPVPLFRGLEREARFYFLHSYCFIPCDPEHVLASCNYHTSICASVGAGNVYGVQFHPEKSHHYGIRLLQNFAEL